MKAAFMRFARCGILPGLVIVIVDFVFGLNSYHSPNAQMNLLIVCISFGMAAVVLGPFAIRAVKWGDSLFRTGNQQKGGEP
jgi:hypothetical protein